MDKARSAENVQVVVRCRPLNSREIKEKQQVICHVETSTEVVVASKASLSSLKTFYFDAAYGPNAGQEDIFNGTVRPIVEEVLEGYNCTIFAYGQTGTGKTFTMEGPPPDPQNPQNSRAGKNAGVITRCINSIFQHLESSKTEYNVKVSHLELYNEEFVDLLSHANTENLKLFEDPKSACVAVHNLTEVNVYNASEIFDILEKSWQERATAETELNPNSSRSHCIFSITIHVKECTDEGQELLRIGKLNLVDLAGSENIARSGAVKERKTEAVMINKSLLTLKRVINALVERSQHVPYRESKLTRLLQDSLGGKTKTCIIATISPASLCVDETLNTLEYAALAKNIKNQPQVNRKVNKKKILQEYSVEIDDLKVQLQSMRRESGVYLPQSHYERMKSEIQTRQERAKELSETIIEKEQLLKKFQEEFDLKEQKLVETQEVLSQTQNTLGETIEKLNQTKDTLKVVETNLVEHRTVLDEHKETEIRFHGEAAGVFETLQGTLGDIKGLHEKIERQSELSTTNESEVNAFRGLVSQRLKEMQARMADYVRLQTARFLDIRKTIDEALPAKQAELRNITQRITELEGVIVAQNLQLAKLNGEHKAMASDQKAYLHQFNVNQNSELSPRIHGTVEAANDGISKFREQLSTKGEENTNWANGFKTELESSRQRTLDHVEEHQQLTQQLRKDAQAQLKSNTAHFSEEQHALAEFYAQQKEAMAQFQNQALLEFNKAMNAFVIKQNETINSALSATTGNLVASQKGLEEFQKSLDESITNIQQKNETFKESQNAFTSTLLQNTDSHVQVEQRTAKDFVARAEAYGCDTSELIITLKNNNNEFQERMAKSSATHYTQLDTLATQRGATLEAMRAQVETAREDLLTDIQTVNSNFSQSVSGWAETLSSNKTEVDQFYVSYQQETSNASDKINSFAFKPLIPTGTTPMKKPYTHPSTLTKPHSDSEIIETLRTNPPLVQPEPLKDAVEQAEAILAQHNQENDLTVEVTVPTTKTPPLMHNSPLIPRTKSLLQSNDELKRGPSNLSKPSEKKSITISQKKGIKEVTNVGST